MFASDSFILNIVLILHYQADPAVSKAVYEESLKHWYSSTNGLFIL